MYMDPDLLSNVKLNKDASEAILDGLKNLMRKRGIRRPTEEIDQAIDEDEIKDLIEDIGDHGGNQDC